PFSSRSQREGVWEQVAASTFIHESNFSHPFFFDGDNGIVLSGLEVKKSRDGGKTWEALLIPGGKGFYSVAFADKKYGWVVGEGLEDKPLVMKTSDGGASWKSASLNLQETHELKATRFSDICLTAGRVWLISENNAIAASVENAGATVWSKHQLGDG